MAEDALNASPRPDAWPRTSSAEDDAKHARARTSSGASEEPTRTASANHAPNRTSWEPTRTDSPEPIHLKAGSYSLNSKQSLDAHPPWCKRFFGIGPEDRDSGMPKSNLIVPLSPFGVLWIGLTSVFLAYTAVFTPPMIALFWLEDPCKPIPTLYFDAILDAFFIFDILVTFSTGVYIEGEYFDDRIVVAKSYFKGFFLFDLITSVPVSFIELAAIAECGRSASGEIQFEVESTELRFARAIKPLRYVKIMRILRLGKGGGLVASLMDHWNISPKMGKTVQVLVSLLMWIHMISCAWWLWKVLAVEADIEQVNQFLDSQPFIGDRKDLSTNWGKMEAYCISLYVTTMTLVYFP